MNIIVGTAGHIDHGKTTLIKALTGIDADRLPEEKERGITIDLGFSELSIGDAHFGFVDVPGHERFVKNMLAGASGIDLVLLVIAADQGVMPQTREHFDICRLLGIRLGIVVLTRVDLADVHTLRSTQLAAAELVNGSFLGSSAVICVDSRSGTGIDLLKTALAGEGGRLPERRGHLITRLPVDRSFSMKGFGAVVTGTLASGEIVEGAELELLPISKTVRVRGLQTHGQTVRAARAGQRLAVNLGGIDHSKVTRGMVLAEPGVLTPTQIIDTEIEVLAAAAKPLRSRQRVRFHIGTVEALARIQVLNESGEISPGAKDLAQVRFETPVVCVPGERFIIRSYSPQMTVAGGKVIDSSAEKHRRRDLAAVREFLEKVLSAGADAVATAELLVRSAGTSGMRSSALQARTGWRSEVLLDALGANLAEKALVRAGGYYLATRSLETLERSAERALAKFHKSDPLAKGISRETLRDEGFAYLPDEIFQTVLASLEADGRILLDREIVRLAAYNLQLSPGETALSEKLEKIYNDAKLEVPKLETALEDAVSGTEFAAQTARKILQLLVDTGKIVKVTDDFYFAKNALGYLAASLHRYADRTPGRLIDVANFKQLAGVSRKYAIPLLEYFDREQLTRRSGDQRLIL